MMKRRTRQREQGMAAVIMVAMLMVVNLIVIGMVLSGGRDHDLTSRSVDTVQAFYAAESGVNMAIREIMRNSDEDADGTIGTISNDGNSANDPQLRQGRVVVTSSSISGQTTITSTGRAGQAKRKVEVLAR